MYEDMFNCNEIICFKKYPQYFNFQSIVEPYQFSINFTYSAGSKSSRESSSIYVGTAKPILAPSKTGPKSSN